MTTHEGDFPVKHEKDLKYTVIIAIAVYNQVQKEIGFSDSDVLDRDEFDRCAEITFKTLQRSFGCNFTVARVTNNIVLWIKEGLPKNMTAFDARKEYRENALYFRTLGADIKNKENFSLTAAMERVNKLLDVAKKYNEVEMILRTEDVALLLRALSDNKE